MTRKRVYLGLTALVLVPAVTAFAGGWAITLVDDLPEYAVVGKPITLQYTVRQHGVSPLSDLNGTVEAVAGSEKTRIAAKSMKEPGRYSATLTVPRAGDWTITIHTGFGNSRATLVPLRAIEAGVAIPVALSEAERGRRLYAAKGCVMCHVEAKVGPDIAGRTYPADFLKKFLADPSVSTSGRPEKMPNLGLKERDIASLVSYINAPKQVGAR
jgi:cytochrome c2